MKDLLTSPEMADCHPTDWSNAVTEPTTEKVTPGIPAMLLMTTQKYRARRATVASATLGYDIFLGLGVLYVWEQPLLNRGLSPNGLLLVVALVLFVFGFGCMTTHFVVTLIDYAQADVRVAKINQKRKAEYDRALKEAEEQQA